MDIRDINFAIEILRHPQSGDASDIKEAFRIAIESLKVCKEVLEQQSTLDKIRAEIEQNAYPIVHGVNNHENGMTLYGILQIIDKYRESEE